MTIQNEVEHSKRMTTLKLRLLQTAKYRSGSLSVWASELIYDTRKLPEADRLDVYEAAITSLTGGRP